jgi:6-phosphogluconolactonase
VITYAFDEENGTLSPASYFQCAPGAGPRHIAFSPDGSVAYVANELDSTLSVCEYDASTGRLQERQRLSTIRQRVDGNTAAHVAAHPSGRTVLVSNRGEDTIATFAVGASGDLSWLESAPSGGAWPRHFALASDGRFLIVANQRSGSVAAFRVDTSAGRISGSPTTVTVPGAVCVLT